MSFDEFIKNYLGVKNVGNTDTNKGECVGLVMVYISEVLKLSHIWGHAKDIFTNAKDNEYKKIKNSPSVYPAKGDIIIWDDTKGGGYGHIAIALFSNILQDTFCVFEQNNPNNVPGTEPEITLYKKWDGVVGWLHPLNIENNDPDLESKIHALEVELSDNKELLNQWKNKAEDLQDKYVEDTQKLSEHIDSLQKTLGEMTQQGSNQLQANTLLKNDNERLRVQITALEKTLSDSLASKDKEIGELKKNNQKLVEQVEYLKKEVGEMEKVKGSYEKLPQEVRVFIEYILPSAVLTALIEYLSPMKVENVYVMAGINISIIFLRNLLARINAIRNR